MAPRHRVVGARPVGHVRRKRRERAPFGGNRRAHGGVAGRVIQNAGPCHPRQHPVARGAGGAGVPVGAAQFRRLRQRHHERRLCRVQARGFLPEPGKRGGAQPLDIAAERGQRQVKLQDVAFVQPPLQRQREPNLAQFARPATGAAAFEQPRHLHAQRRGARHDAPMRQCLPGGTGHRPRIDPAMPVKSLVLVGQQHRPVERVHLAGAHAKPPAPVGDGIGAQQAVIAVQHLDRGFHRQRRQLGAGHPVVDRVTQQRRNEQRHDQQ